MIEVEWLVFRVKIEMTLALLLRHEQEKQMVIRVHDELDTQHSRSSEKLMCSCGLWCWKSE